MNKVAHLPYKISLLRKIDIASLLDFLIKIIVTVAVIGSLCFEIILHLQPCYLCWWQRILWFPMFIIMWVRMPQIYKYNILKVFSCLGSIVAGYHFYLQFLIGFTAKSAATLCLSSSTIECSTVQFKLFPYVSIATLSLIGFIIIYILSSIGSSSICARRDSNPQPSGPKPNALSS